MTENITIRKMTQEDLEPPYRLLSDPRVMRYLEPPFTKEKTQQFLETAGRGEPPLVYAAEKEDTFIGYVICHPYDEDSVEIGWVLYPEYWGKGYASLLTEQMMKKIRSEGKLVVIECVP